jgi:hypothetical protein
MNRLMCALLPLFVLSCAENAGPVRVDARWNLTCPSGSAASCTTPAETCLGDGGLREIVGQHGEQTCTGDPIIASCEAVERSDGTRLLFLEASVGSGIDEFAFELRGASIDAGGTAQTACVVTIIEAGDAYGSIEMLGACGGDPPSVDQPCQLSNISAMGGEVSFDLECATLVSRTTGFAFDVGALGGGPTTMSFTNCSGF